MFLLVATIIINILLALIVLGGAASLVQGIREKSTASIVMAVIIVILFVVDILAFNLGVSLQAA